MPTPEAPQQRRSSAPAAAATSAHHHLWRAVVEARAALAKERAGPQRAATAEVRAELLDALEAYVACLHAQHRPIPYALRDELRIQQLLSPGSRSRPS